MARLRPPEERLLLVTFNYDLMLDPARNVGVRFADGGSRRRRSLISVGHGERRGVRVPLVTKVELEHHVNVTVPPSSGTAVQTHRRRIVLVR